MLLLLWPHAFSAGPAPSDIREVFDFDWRIARQVEWDGSIRKRVHIDGGIRRRVLIDTDPLEVS